MSKKNKKLSLKRETLRQLDSLTPAQLGAVAGGTLVAYDGNKALSGIRPPLTGTCSCETGLCLQYDYNFDGYKLP